MHTNLITPMKDLGAELVGRSAGARLRERIVHSARTGLVVVDLAGIEAISPSFADELFGKLPRDLVRSRRVRFVNASEDIRALARGVRGNRARLVPA